jgi:hypothetical protein
LGKHHALRKHVEFVKKNAGSAITRKWLKESGLESLQGRGLVRVGPMLLRPAPSRTKGSAV